MRRVRRPKAPPSSSEKATLDERETILRYYEHWDGRTPYPSDKYKAYRAKDVRPALTEAFFGKCAYCETYYASTQQMAIEHYRPKGAVKIDGALVPPGYYWLASEWTNLLPSCTDCNSARGQELPGSVERTVGKANAFPLASEASRAKAPGEEHHEKRLVLHPYLDFPERHLTFTWGTGTIEDGWISPRRRSRKGAATIEVCGLQRRGLRRARRERLDLLQAHLRSALDAQRNVQRHPDDDELVQQLTQRIADIRQFTNDEAPYAAMCREVVDDFFEHQLGIG
ncbi:hypothetical protein GCM10025789_17450 [Tessaracoccus lubricantis]|uniref:TIGR02646 family protein n=1 Tax=Tessaracoccus lubricantis TaxID=545543 RepID=A0ABP9FDD3_9ACTN